MLRGAAPGVTRPTSAPPCLCAPQKAQELARSTGEQDVVKPLLSGAVWKLSAPHFENDPLPPASCQALLRIHSPHLSLPLSPRNSFKDLQQSSEMNPPPTSSLLPVERSLSLEQCGPSALRLYMLRGAGHTLDCMSEKAGHFSWLVTRIFMLLSPLAAPVSTPVSIQKDAKAP